MEIQTILGLSGAQTLELGSGIFLLLLCSYISFPLSNWIVQKTFNNWYKFASSDYTKAFFHKNLSRKILLLKVVLIQNYFSLVN